MPKEILPFMTDVAGHVLVHDPKSGEAYPPEWTGVCVSASDTTKHWYVGQEKTGPSFHKLAAVDPVSARQEALAAEARDEASFEPERSNRESA
jgi:hypothetical protein